MADLTEDPLAPDWGEIEKGNTSAIADALFLIWQRLSVQAQLISVVAGISGFWIPTDASGAGLALTAGICHYLRIGQVVIAWYDITYPVTASGAASKIGGIPYLAMPGSNGSFGGFMVSTNYNATMNEVTLNGATNTFAFRDTGGAAVTNVALSGKVVRGTLIYPAAT